MTEVKMRLQVVREFIGRKYNKVKERMEKGTREDDESAENVGEPMICAICSVRDTPSLLLCEASRVDKIYLFGYSCGWDVLQDECKRTEKRAYMNCGHTYHCECYRTKRMANCLVCGQEILSFLPVAEGESIFW